MVANPALKDVNVQSPPVLGTAQCHTTSQPAATRGLDFMLVEIGVNGIAQGVGAGRL